MKQDGGSQTQDLLARLIVDHLTAHPHAADSADGIRLWWLGAIGVVARLDEVECALATLADQGRVRLVKTADGTLLYSKPVRNGTASTNGVHHE